MLQSEPCVNVGIYPLCKAMILPLEDFRTILCDDIISHDIIYAALTVESKTFLPLNLTFESAEF